MYEFVGGTGRLAYALYHAKEDPARIDRLADLLHYYPDQLKEDIAAATDFFEKFKVQAAQDNEEDTI